MSMLSENQLLFCQRQMSILSAELVRLYSWCRRCFYWSFFTQTDSVSKAVADRSFVSEWEIVYLHSTEELTTIPHTRSRNQLLPARCAMLPMALPWHRTLSVPPFLVPVWLVVFFLFYHSSFHSFITMKVRVLIVIWCLPFKSIFLEGWQCLLSPLSISTVLNLFWVMYLLWNIFLCKAFWVEKIRCSTKHFAYNI